MITSFSATQLDVAAGWSGRQSKMVRCKRKQA
jgi:hypothetical protein